jgi:hypothetical protein
MDSGFLYEPGGPTLTPGTGIRVLSAVRSFRSAQAAALPESHVPISSSGQPAPQ